MTTAARFCKAAFLDYNEKILCEINLIETTKNVVLARID